MNNKTLLKVAAVCSIIGAATTLILVLIDVPEAATFDDKIKLHENPKYMGKLWIFFFHPQLNLMAALGILTLLFRKKPALVVPGFLFIAIWAVTEAAQYAFTIDAINQYWRAGYLKATDETMRS